MKKTSKWMLAAAAAGALMISAPSSANAQVAFQGTFGGPHGSVSIGVGAPFAVGAVVPYPYVRHVYVRPSYGYGFYYGAQWIPVQPYGAGYVVVAPPVAYGYAYPHRRYYYNRGYRYHPYWH